MAQDQYEEVVSRTRSAMPDDLPNAAEFAKSHPDRFVLRNKRTGKSYRLRHTHWEPVIERKTDSGS